MPPFSLIYYRHRYFSAELLYFSSSFAQLEDSACIPLAVHLIRVLSCSPLISYPPPNVSDIFQKEK